MELVLDFGNTHVKAFIFENNTIVSTQIFTLPEFENNIDSYIHKEKISQCISCSVTDNSRIIERIKAIVPCMEFSDITPIPLSNLYESKQTLGLDRLAAAIGAEEISPNSNKLIIDFGTAITIDFISKEKEFKGGNISVGMESRFKALHDYTNKLPKLSAQENISLYGKNTQEAIQNGVIQGIIFEVEGYILKYQTIFPDILVFLTGGDAKFFEKMVKKPIFAEPNLIAFGLHRILQYNA